MLLGSPEGRRSLVELDERGFMVKERSTRWSSMGTNQLILFRLQGN